LATAPARWKRILKKSQKSVDSGSQSGKVPALQGATAVEKKSKISLTTGAVRGKLAVEING
jgi:hypothetical protein